jgi:hypothetical protein
MANLLIVALSIALAAALCFLIDRLLSLRPDRREGDDGGDR